MLGAIIGDIVGSPFEFDRRKQLARTPFMLFQPTAHFTDDTVMTVAIAEAILEYQDENPGKVVPTDLAACCREKMVKWGRKHPLAGYGGRFGLWIWKKDPQPYQSYGNGSGMRVSPVGYLFDDLNDVLAAAEASALPSHDHPEGIKGAQAIAYMIWAARNHKPKEEMKAEVEKRFGYDLNFTIDEIRPTYHMDETCQGSVPHAIVAFLESDSYENCIRTAVSFGGDTDTIACMAGGIAEAYYGIPGTIQQEGWKRLPLEMRFIIEEAYLRMNDTVSDQS